MNRRPAVVAPLLAGVVLFAGACSSEVAESVALPVSESTEVAAPFEVSPRGALVWEVGREAIVSTSASGDGPESFRFTLDAMTRDPQCDVRGSGGRAKGEWLQMDFTINTVDPRSAALGILAKYDFYAVTDSGQIFEIGETTGDMCVDSAVWVGVEDPKPNSMYKATILADIPDGAVTIGYDWTLNGSSSSWEWDIPSAV